MRQIRWLALIVFAGAQGSAVLGLSPHVFAQDAGSQKLTVEERLQAIEQKLQDLEKRLAAIGVQTKETPSSSLGTLDQRFEALDQRVRTLEGLRGSEQESAAVQAREAPTLGTGREGFFLKSRDESFQLKLRGLFQWDARWALEDKEQAIANTFFLRRVRPIFEGTVFKYFDFRVTPDFGSGQTVLQDLFLDVNFWPHAKFRLGKFKTPVGLERLQSASDLLFIERALPNNLVPNRDVGVQMYGDLAGGSLSYAAGFFNGVVDGGSGDFDDRDSKDGAARIFAHPFKRSNAEWLQGLGLGLAGSFGNQKGSPSAPNLPSFKTTGQQTFFRYRSDGTEAGTVVAAGEHFRLSPQAYYYGGPFGLLAEYVFSSQAVRRGATVAQLENDSWQVAASYVLTGEKASYRSVAPEKSFDLAADNWGAFEIAGRYSQLTVDRKAFPTFANPQTAARRAKAWAMGFNWYFNKNVKFVVNYEQTNFDGGGIRGNRGTEKVVLSRLQLAY